MRSHLFFMVTGRMRIILFEKITTGIKDRHLRTKPFVSIKSVVKGFLKSRLDLFMRESLSPAISDSVWQESQSSIWKPSWGLFIKESKSWQRGLLWKEGCLFLKGYQGTKHFQIHWHIVRRLKKLQVLQYLKEENIREWFLPVSYTHLTLPTKRIV